MKLRRLMQWATDKLQFRQVEDYANFCHDYLDFITHGIQAVIVSQRVNHYLFYQYKDDGSFNVTRPINGNLMIPHNQFDYERKNFIYALAHIKEIGEDPSKREGINKFIYTCQQSIGAALDALPAGKSNTARKINGDLFERFIRLIISEIGIDVREGTMKLPVIIDDGEYFSMSYQHDIVIEEDGKLLAIGSVKTSSKDRLDKIFIDKFIYNRLTNSATPHFAVFLNDVQRSGKDGNYKVSATFLPGHFKGYTVKLNPLDGVYYCDMLPIMRNDKILRQHIQTLDRLLIEDIWKF